MNVSVTATSRSHDRRASSGAAARPRGEPSFQSPEECSRTVLRTGARLARGRTAGRAVSRVFSPACPSLEATSPCTETGPRRWMSRHQSRKTRSPSASGAVMVDARLQVQRTVRDSRSGTSASDATYAWMPTPRPSLPSARNPRPSRPMTTPVCQRREARRVEPEARLPVHRGQQRRRARGSAAPLASVVVSTGPPVRRSTRGASRHCHRARHSARSVTRVRQRVAVRERACRHPTAPMSSTTSAAATVPPVNVAEQRPRRCEAQTG